MPDKLLPLPLGGATPEGSTVRAWQQYGFQTQINRASTALGVSLALLGCWLGLNPRPTEVGVDKAGYHLGDTVLTAVGGGAYNGETSIVIRQQDGHVQAASAGKLRGEDMKGICILVQGTDTEQCIFVVGRSSFHAVDRLRDGAWHRRYDGGQQVVIPVADTRDPAPVPVPLGWGDR